MLLTKLFSFRNVLIKLYSEWVTDFPGTFRIRKSWLKTTLFREPTSNINYNTLINLISNYTRTDSCIKGHWIVFEKWTSWEMLTSFIACDWSLANARRPHLRKEEDDVLSNRSLTTRWYWIKVYNGSYASLHHPTQSIFFISD